MARAKKVDLTLQRIKDPDLLEKEIEIEETVDQLDTKPEKDPMVKFMENMNGIVEKLVNSVETLTERINTLEKQKVEVDQETFKQSTNGSGLLLGKKRINNLETPDSVRKYNIQQKTYSDSQTFSWKTGKRVYDTKAEAEARITELLLADKKLRKEHFRVIHFNVIKATKFLSDGQKQVISAIDDRKNNPGGMGFRSQLDY